MKSKDGSDYSKYHDIYHPGLHEFKERFGFYDIFLIDFNSGDVVYSVTKEVDFATNLLTGTFRSSGLADVVRSVRKNPVRDKVHIVDFSPYAPSYNAPASFIGSPVYNGQHIVGIIVFQIPSDKIQDIMSSQRNWRKEGMGESGETYLVGADLLMRSDSRFLIEDKETYFDHIRGMGLKEEIITLMDKIQTSILLQPIQTKSAQLAIKGEEGQLITNDYRGVSVLASYSKLDIDGLNWGIISEINEEEAFRPIKRLLRHILLSTAIFIPIIAYLSYLLSQGFMRPVQTLVATAKTIRSQYNTEQFNEGDITKFETEGASEYQELSDEMNQVMHMVRVDSDDIRKKEHEYADLITKALPVAVAERLKNNEELITDSADEATAIFIQIDNSRSVLDFTDLHATTRLMEKLTTKIHESAENNGIDLYDEIGMEFLGICGLTMPYLNHFERSMKFAQSVLKIIEKFNATNETDLKVSIGAEVGPMFGTLQTGRVIGYNVLSDSIYTAQEAAYAGALGQLTVSDMTKEYCEKMRLKLEWEKDTASIKVKGDQCAIWNISKADLGSLK
ncbi:MAG: adenylate/guanylate cyclase domain-containing protein [Cocleimonas sp.]